MPSHDILGNDALVAPAALARAIVPMTVRIKRDALSLRVRMVLQHPYQLSRGKQRNLHLWKYDWHGLNCKTVNSESSISTALLHTCFRFGTGSNWVRMTLPAEAYALASGEINIL